jgi:hypothetical protein
MALLSKRRSNARELHGMFSKLDKLEALDETLLGEIADAIRSILVANIARGVSPYGDIWPLVRFGKRKGQKALVNAAKELFVVPYQKSVIVRLVGQTAMHHHGAVRGGRDIDPPRRVIPIAKLGIPDAIKDAIKAICDRAFSRIAEAA